MRKLPIGIQDFRELRTGDYLYIDKTEYIHRMVTRGKYYFLSRPRRFGKSLTVSTLKELFSGSRKLFEGLWVEREWNWKRRHPIIHIPFSRIGYKEMGLEAALHRELDQIAVNNGLSISEPALSQKFQVLIRQLSAGGNAVLLIDEYDKPIIDFLGDRIELAKENQQILKNFYSVIKDSDPYLRLVFITGVSKFSKVSIFSDLNNLEDITSNRFYASMLGYTQEELEGHFPEYINLLTKAENKPDILAEIKTWYNGYSWDARHFVYNPFSILLLFSNASFGNYWFQTATPTFLINLLKERVMYDLDGEKVSELAFESFSLDNFQLVPLLFQTGYLTIKAFDPETRLYTLGYPNREVRDAMLEHLIAGFSGIESAKTRPLVLDLRNAFQRNDLAKVISLINNLFSNLPYPLHQKTEGFYHAIIHTTFYYLGVYIQSEVHTADGRADAVVETDSHVYCLEFKLDKSAGAALRQIKEKGYLDKYQQSGKILTAVGINLPSEAKKIVEWKEMSGN